MKKIVGPQRASKHSTRTMLNAMLWRVRTGTQWRNLPPHFPPWASVYYHFRRWQQSGQWQTLLAQLVRQERQRLGYPTLPAYVVLDSQSVKTAPMVRQSKGFDGFKRIRGRKRHGLVDEAGLPLGLLISRANQGDNKAAEPLLSGLAATTPHRPVLLVDAVYPHTFVSWAAGELGWPVEVLVKPKARHFVAVARRWVVERSFGRIGGPMVELVSSAERGPRENSCQCGGHVTYGFYRHFAEPDFLKPFPKQPLKAYGIVTVYESSGEYI